MRRLKIAALLASLLCALAMATTAYATAGDELVIEGTSRSTLALSTRKLVDNNEIPGTGEVVFRVRNTSSSSGLSIVFYRPGVREYTTIDHETLERHFKVGETVTFEVQAIEKPSKRTATIKAKAPKKHK